MTATAARRVVTQERAQPRREENPALSFYLIAASSALLVAFGAVMRLSASTVTAISDTGSPYQEWVGQLLFVVVGVVGAVVAAILPPGFYRRAAWVLLAGGLALQSLIFTGFARGQGGNLNWIVVPGTGQVIQPAEFLKLALAIWLGAVLARKVRVMDNLLHAAIPGVLGSVAAIALVLAGHDMGTAAIMVVLVAGAYFVAGLRLRWFAVVGVVGAGLAAFLIMSSDSRRQRVAQFFGLTESDPLGAGLQPLHGLWALGSGGISGVGLGASREKWEYLPEAHNDFIFAIIGEELGLIGTLVVLALFAVLAAGIYRVVRRHHDPFVQIAAAGLGAWIFGQAIVNMLVVIGLLPVLGVPLPLVSAGGSALIATLLGVGVLLSFARTEPGAREALRVRSRSARRTGSVTAPRRRSGRG
ncbi:peptidoglycan glycosyltransferase FtsW [Georgenia sp. Z1491]|uniref:peptidoglycan glycosyltransferase FtsW n=1 Tax=Georgenia sp. Z1491 TaxID=3416707 RepID=UPI003CF68BB8